MNMWSALEWRLLGPFRGGRVAAVAGDWTDTRVFYMGSTGGGVWKTTDGGIYWENVSDGYFQRASVGAIAVAQAEEHSGHEHDAERHERRLEIAGLAKLHGRLPGGSRDAPVGIALMPRWMRGAAAPDSFAAKR